MEAFPNDLSETIVRVIRVERERERERERESVPISEEQGEKVAKRTRNRDGCVLQSVLIGSGAARLRRTRWQSGALCRR